MSDKKRGHVTMQYAPFIAITSAASTALIFGLLGTLTLPACVMVTLAASALAGGTVFTIIEMHRLTKN
jgi:hypothetical protein